MADRRSILRGLAALPAFASAKAEADAIASVKARNIDALRRPRPTDPFAGYHREIMDIQAKVDVTPEDSDEEDVLWARWGEIDRLAMASTPTTTAGAIGALEYARRELHQFRVENCPDPSPSDLLILHLIDGAIDVLRNETEAHRG